MGEAGIELYWPLLQRDPLHNLPARMPGLPKSFNAGALPCPLLAGRRRAPCAGSPRWDAPAATWRCLRSASWLTAAMPTSSSAPVSCWTRSPRIAV